MLISQTWYDSACSWTYLLVGGAGMNWSEHFVNFYLHFQSKLGGGLYFFFQRNEGGLHFYIVILCCIQAARDNYSPVHNTFGCDTGGKTVLTIQY